MYVAQENNNKVSGMVGLAIWQINRGVRILINTKNTTYVCTPYPWMYSLDPSGVTEEGLVPKGKRRGGEDETVKVAAYTWQLT